MAIQNSTTTRNRIRDAFSTAFPAGSVLSLRTGAPAGVGNSAGGTEVAAITLPATPYTATNGVLSLNGSWSDAADAAGIIAHYRLTNGADIEEGTVTEAGGGGDAIVDNADVNIGQIVSVLTFTRTVFGA